MNGKDTLVNLIIIIAVFLIAVNFSYTVLETVFSKEQNPGKSNTEPVSLSAPVKSETRQIFTVEPLPVKVELTPEVTDPGMGIDIDSGMGKVNSLFNHAIQIDFLVNMAAEKCDLSHDFVLEEKRMIMMGLNENYVFIRKAVEIYSEKTLKRFRKLLEQFSLFNKIHLVSKDFDETLEFDFFLGDSKVYNLKIYRKPEKLPDITPSGSGKLSIIVDDMGRNTETSIKFHDLPPEIALSFLPDESHAVASAAHAARKGHVVMIHIPMESLGKYYKFKDGKGVNTSMSATQIETYINSMIDQFPMAQGINNHTGSKATQTESAMLPVMRVIKRRNLFFVDSKTTPLTVAYSLARKAGIRTAIRTVFLDNTNEEDAIREMLEYACKSAKSNGHSVAICHPHKNTLNALNSFLKDIKKKDIMLVPITDLLIKEN